MGLALSTRRVGKSVPRRSVAGSGLRRRRGSATIDYFLLICILLPLAALVLHVGPRAMRLVYDLLTVVVAWPFL